MTTRRDFLHTSGSAVGGAWLLRLAPVIAATQACASEARREGRPFETFTEREGADFEALSARIVPSGDTPGAREAGVVYFADQALGSFMADLLPIVRQGLADVHARVASSHPGTGEFAQLSEEAQDGIIAAVAEEDPTFFFFAKTLVLVGLVANPERGGNAEQIGWRLIGFDDRYQYEPPFGYYDRNEHRSSTAEGDGAPAQGDDR